MFPAWDLSTYEQVANVYVPFIFKYAIDYLNASQPAMAAGQSAVLTSATALVLACAPRSLVFNDYIQYSYALSAMWRQWAWTLVLARRRPDARLVVDNGRTAERSVREGGAAEHPAGVEARFPAPALARPAIPPLTPDWRSLAHHRPRHRVP